MIDVTKTPLEEIFGYSTKQSELKDVCDYITKTFVKPRYTSIPKEYYPFLYKLLSFRTFDYKSNYKEGDIRTFYVGTTEYKNQSIAFFDKNGNHDFLGCTTAIKHWQENKNNEFENMRKCVVQICRNLARFRIVEKQKSINLPIKCEISGVVIDKFEDIQIDHYDDDFSKVVYDWMYALKKLTENHKHKFVDIVKILYDAHDENFKYFKSKKLNRSFIDFHDSHTHLRITHKNANLKKEKYKPTWDFLKINGCYLEKYAQEKSDK